MTVARPADEEARLAALRSYAILDTPPEEAFNDLVHVAAFGYGTPIAQVAFVDDHREWSKAGVGTALHEVPRDVAFAAHAILSPDPLVVTDAADDPRFAGNPLVQGDPHIRFYAGAPLVTPDGHALGTVSVADRLPRTDPGDLGPLQALSRQVVDRLELRRKVAALGRALIARGQTEETERGLVHLLQSVAIASNAASALEEAAQTAVDEVCAFMGWPIGHLYLVDQDGSWLVPSSVWHLDQPERFAPFRTATDATRLPNGLGLVGRVASGGGPSWLEDVTSDPEFVRAEVAGQLGIRAGFAFPVLVDSRVVGVLEFFSNEPVDPGRRLLGVMVQVGTQLGRVVERSEAATALGETEQERARLSDHLRLVLESAADGIYGLDREGRFTFVNRSAVELLGWSADELVSRDAHALVHHSHADGSPYRPEDCPNLTTLRTGEGRRVDDEVIWHKGGTALPVTYSSLPIKEGGAVEGALVIFTDLSQRRRAEEALRRLALVEDRERIARDLHDGVIQSLFAVGMGLSATMAVGGSDAVRRRIEAAVEDLDRVIAEVRGYIFSLRSGLLARRHFGDALRELAHELEERAGVATAVEVDEAVAARLEAPAGELLQVVREALSNVGRHAGAATCHVRLVRHGEEALLEIEDDGKGFSLESVQGQGQGLGNLRARARALGGKLEIGSAPGGGTSVRALIPL